MMVIFKQPKDPFTALGTSMIAEADKIVCDLATYIAGLRSIIEQIEIAIEAGEESLAREEEDDGE